MANPLPTDRNKTSSGMSSTVHEVTQSLKNLIQSEIKLAKAEISDNASYFGKQAAIMAGFAALAGIALFPFMAFLTIGLGRLLGDNYWLSSLIVSAVFAVVGGIVAYSAFKKIKSHGLRLDETARTLRQDLEIIENKANEVGSERRVA